MPYDSIIVTLQLSVLCWQVVLALFAEGLLRLIGVIPPLLPYSDNIEVIGITLLLVFAATMFYQGTMILRGHRGYRHI